MRTPAPPAGEPRPFTWSVQSTDIHFMPEDAEERGCGDCSCYDCGCIVPRDPPPKRKAPLKVRAAGGARARGRP